METKKPMTRRAFLRRVIGAGLALGVGGFLYSHVIERQWLEVHRVKLAFSELPSEFDGMKVVHFSDLHIGFFFGEAQMERVALAIEAEQADVICFTGDLVDDSLDELSSCVPYLQQLQARLGKFAVLGNHDYAESPEGVQSALEESGFRVLLNDSAPIRSRGAEIYISGMEDALHARPDPVRALAKVPDGHFTLMLMHEAVLADEVASYPVSLQLSGHSHGGQIRLPWLGHVVTPPLGERYVDRLHQVPGRELLVYTSRGIGTTGIPLRFLCRPEIAVIELVRDAEESVQSSRSLL